MSDLLVPLIIGLIVLYGLLKGCHIFDAFMEGAGEGLRVVYKLAPSMIGIMLAIAMFKASGALDLFSAALDPLLRLVGIPREVAPLVILRPVSGSGALAIYKDIIESHGPDSFVGRVASVMQGATETTFYTMAVYYGVTKVKKTRHTLVSAAAGDLVGFIFSALTVSLLMV